MLARLRAERLDEHTLVQTVAAADTLAEGLAELTRRGIRGKAITPFLLDHFQRATAGESLRVNKQLVRNNARLAARVARAWADLDRGPDSARTELLP